MVENYAKDNISTSNDITLEIRKTLIELNSNPVDVCDDKLIYKMRTAQFKSEYIKDIGYTKNNKLICTTGLGLLEKPFDEPEPQFTTSSNIDMWVNVPPIKLFNFLQVATVAKYGNFNVVINVSEIQLHDDATQRNAIYIRHSNDELIFLKGGDESLIPIDDKKGTTWNDIKGFYSFQCSKESSICTMSFIPLSAALKKRTNTYPWCNNTLFYKFTPFRRFYA